MSRIKSDGSFSFILLSHQNLIVVCSIKYPEDLRWLCTCLVAEKICEAPVAQNSEQCREPQSGITEQHCAVIISQDLGVTLMHQPGSRVILEVTRKVINSSTEWHTLPERAHSNPAEVTLPPFLYTIHMCKRR